MKIATYQAETIQIYFPASLELQEELIKNGFNVPGTTPIPIIYINFKGWIGAKPPVTIERLIAPIRYGASYADRGWTKTSKGGKEAYEIPSEESYLSFETLEKDKLKIVLHPIKYHLERVSIRGVNPEKWNNWAMVYISLEDAKDLQGKLVNAGIKPSIPMKPKREVQQGGKEKTYYLPVRVYDFGLCLGCFEDALEYLRSEEKKQGISVDIARLKLRLRRGKENTYAKVGISQMEGKHQQLMVKLASQDGITIEGILKPIIEGKPRGILEYCNHSKIEQSLILSASEFLGAMISCYSKVETAKMKRLINNI